MYAYKYNLWTQSVMQVRACAGGGVGTSRERSIGEKGIIHNTLNNKEFKND